MPQPDGAWYFQEVATLISQLYTFWALRDKARQTLGQMRAVCDMLTHDPNWPLYEAGWQRAEAAFEMFLGDNPFRAQLMLADSTATYLRFGQRRMAALVLIEAGINSIALGDWPQTQKLGQQASALAEQLGDLHLRAATEIVLCGAQVIANDQHKLTDVREHLEAIIAGAGDDQIRRGQALSMLAASHFNCQQWQQAVDRFRESTEVLQMLPAVLPYSYACLTTSLLRLGRVSEAAATAELGTMTLSLIQDGGPYAPAMWQVKAETQQALGQAALGLQSLRRAVDLLRKRLLFAPSAEARRMLIENVPQHRRTATQCQALLGEELFPQTQ
jgi:tetratricopeptide (TPR) repeat protein